MTERYGRHGVQAIPAFLERPYSWILLFSRESQQRYRYSIEAAEIDGHVVVRFQPLDRANGSLWYGSVIVDLASYQIVRAEGLQAADYWEKTRMKQMLDSPAELPDDIDLRTFIVRQVVTEFDSLHHGLRFPSAVEVVIDRYRLRGSGDYRRKMTTRAATIKQTYRNYRFFEIELLTEFVEDPFEVELQP